VTEVIDQSLSSQPKCENPDEIDLEFEKLIKSLKEKPTTTPGDFAPENMKVKPQDGKQYSNDVNKGMENEEVIVNKPIIANPIHCGSAKESETMRNSEYVKTSTNQSGEKVNFKINDVHHHDSKLHSDIPKNSISQRNDIQNDRTTLKESKKLRISKPTGIKKLSASSENVRLLVSKFEDPAPTDGLKSSRNAPNDAKSMENLVTINGQMKNTFSNLKACFEPKLEESLSQNVDDDVNSTIIFDDDDIVHLPLNVSDLAEPVFSNKNLESRFSLVNLDQEFDRIFDEIDLKASVEKGSDSPDVQNEKGVANNVELEFKAECDLQELDKNENWNSFERETSDEIELKVKTFDGEDQVFVPSVSNLIGYDLKESDVDGLSDDDAYDSEDLVEPFERHSAMKVMIQLKRSNGDLRESDVDGAAEHEVEEVYTKFDPNPKTAETNGNEESFEVVKDDDSDLKFTVNIVNQKETIETDGDGQSSSSSR